MNRIEKDLGVEVEFEALFDFPSVQTLAAHIEQMIASGNTIIYEKITPAIKQDHYVTSHAQRRLWFIHQYQPGLTAYNMPFAFELEGLHQEAFIKAFLTLEERHESLRTTFLNIDGLPMQKIHLPGSLGFHVAYADFRTHENGAGAAKAWADEEAVRPFDLEKGPLLRATLLQLGDARFVFLFTIHHIISDGWSLEVLMREVSALYEAYANGHDNPLQPLRVQYKDFVYWQNNVINAREEAFWLSKLAGELSLINLPFDVEGVENNTFIGDRVHTRINEATTAGLRELALRHNTSLSNVILSVFNILLANISGQEDILIGMATANRSHLDTEGLIGFFVNTLIIRNQISTEMNFEEVLQQVTQAVVEAYQHQNYPFDLLVEKLNPERLVNRQAIFNVMYAFQNYADVAIDINTNTEEVFTGQSVALQGKVFEQEINNAYFDLTNFVSDYGNELLIGFNYNSDLFEKSTIEGLLDTYTEFIALTANTIAENASL